MRLLRPLPWLLLIGIAPAAARAQNGPIEIRQFQPTPFSDGYLRLDGPAVLPAWKLKVGAIADYAWKPLVLTDVAPSIQRSRKTTYDFIAHAVGVDLTIALGLGHRFELAAIVPVTAFQTGEAIPDGETPGVVGIENPKIGAKVHLLGGESGGFGLGASVLATLPFGLGGAFVHDTAIGGEGRLFAEMAGERWNLRASGGYRLRGATQIFDIPIDDELTFAAGGEGRVTGALRLFAEVAGATSAARPFDSPKQTPVELLLGARRELGAHWLGGDNRFWLTMAAGPGLTAGYGSPAVRAVVALAWSNRPTPRPPVEPVAPPAPAPPPPPKCPGDPSCPPPPPPSDRDKDGIIDDDDECPDEPEDKDGFEDEDGCPDPDNDKDGILDAADKCPNEPETINGFQDEDGCPDKGAAEVHIGKEELETLKPIFFETDHSRVRHAFYSILGQIALTLKAHPEIGRCAVEGHTDDTGPPEWNQKLSLLRAEAVVEFLVGKGVERERLTAIGHGEKVPWAPNDTESGRAQNRRVLFHIEGVNVDQLKKEEKKQERRERARAHKAASEPGTAPGSEAGSDKKGSDSEKRAAPAGRQKEPAAGRDAAGTAPPETQSTTRATTPPETRSTQPPGPAQKPRGAGPAESEPAGEPALKFKPLPTPGQKKRPTAEPKSDKPATLRDLLRLPEQ